MHNNQFVVVQTRTWTVDCKNLVLCVNCDTSSMVLFIFSQIFNISKIGNFCVLTVLSATEFFCYIIISTVFLNENNRTLFT